MVILSDEFATKCEKCARLSENLAVQHMFSPNNVSRMSENTESMSEITDNMMRARQF